MPNGLVASSVFVIEKFALLFFFDEGGCVDGEVVDIDVSFLTWHEVRSLLFLHSLCNDTPEENTSAWLGDIL